jgi:hypothetical protein
MIQADPPSWPDVDSVQDDYVIPYSTLRKLGDGDAKAGRRRLRTMIDVEMVHQPVTGPTPKPSNVRLAGIDDEYSLADLLRADIAENASRVAPISEEAIFSFIQASTRDIHGLGAAKPNIAVIGSSSKIEAAVFLELNQWFWSDHWHLAERTTIVHPDFRRSRHVDDLIDFCKWMADQMSASVGHKVYLLSQVVGTKDVDRKSAKFGRLMERVGATYVYPSPPRA